MKLKRKIISVLMMIALIISSIPLTLMPGSMTVSAAPADPSYVLNRPTGGIYVNEVTRVAYAVNSLKPPSGNNSVIVKATKSGIPYISSTFADIAYSGETPYATKVSFTPGVTLEKTPVISCSNTTVKFVSATPAFANGTYTWTVDSGTAEVGSALIFTVSYSYSETNPLSGKTYTNNYESKCVSYVEAIASPAGIYSQKRTFENFVVGTDTKCRSYIATLILGENTYGSVYNNGTGDGTVDFTNNQAFTASTAAWTEDYGTMKRFGDSTASKEYNVAIKADGNRPLSTVYIDKSITSTLSALNLRFHTVIPMFASSSKERVTVSINNSFVSPGIVNTFSGSDSSSNPSNDESAAAQLGITLSKVSAQSTSTSLKSTALSYFEGVGPCKENGESKYTVSLRYNTPADWVNVHVGQSFSFKFITYDKGSLRTLVEEIGGTDPTTMSVNLPEGDFKGYNPQAWYYSSGWEAFDNAYIIAKKTLAKPNVSQQDIDSAYSSLETAYANLEMKKADYSLADAYYKQASAKVSSNYTLASWAKLQTLIDKYLDDCSVLYQPAVDKAAVDIKEAMDKLEYATANYDEFNANLKTVNKLISETPTIYGKSASEVYSGWAKLESVLQNSGCVYNELEGYTIGKYLDVTEQPTVDGYTLLLKNAIDSLKVVGADYSNAVKAESSYKVLSLAYIVDDVAENLKKAYDELIALHGLDLSRQADVDKATATLNYWLDNIEYKPADISAAETLIATANAIDRTQYSDFTAVDSAIANLQSKLNLDIRYQSEIDRAVDALRSAIDKLTTNGADYSDVDKAISEADEVSDNIIRTYADTYGFTAATFYSNWTDVQNAINSVVRNLGMDKQSQVDGYATAIRSAIAALQENKADYSAVTVAQNEVGPIIASGSTLYTAESLSKLTDAYVAVVKNLNISKQAEVDAYAEAIRTAVAELEYLPADYSKVDEKINEANQKLKDNDDFANTHTGYTLYTVDSISALDLAIASVDRSLDIRYQSTVNQYVTAIESAMNGLAYAPADYTQVELAKANIPADTSLYTNLSLATLNSVIKKIDTTLTADKQATVDGYVTSINNAINNLKYKKADYSKVNAAKAKVPSDSSLYTEESWNHLQDKLSDVVEGLDIRYQTQVDTYAEAIETAISVLLFKPADYSEVNKALSEVPADLSVYTEDSVNSLNNTINGIDKYLDIRYQSTVDGYASDIRSKIGLLNLKSADYSEVVKAVNNANTKIAEGIYTDESVAEVNKAISDVVYNLDITEQARVDGFAKAVNDAVSKLVEKFVAADYTQVDSEISKIPTDLTVYTDKTVEILNNAVNAVDRSLGKKEQAKVDEFAAAIRSAREALVLKGANYSSVNTAKSKIPADSSLYTAESWQNLQDKVNAVVENLDITQQSRVDKFAKDIEDAVAALKYISADYSEVTKAKGEIPTNLALYTDETVAQLNAVLDGIDYNLDITKQSIVDAYPTAIRNAVSNLVLKGADYSAVNAAKGKVPTDSSIYTEESWRYLQDKLNAVIEGLDITHQAEVDKFAKDIEDAIGELDYIGANYDDVKKAIEEANAAMDEELHTAASRAAVKTEINKVNYSLDASKQATVDAYAAAIRKAVSELKFNPADYTAVNNAKAKVPTDSTLYTNVSWQNLQNKLDAVVEGLDIRYQVQVNAYANDIENALNKLEFLPADYTNLLKSISEAREAIQSGMYTDESANSLINIINSVEYDLDIRYQKKVDMYEQSVRLGIDNLKYRSADYTVVNDAKAAAEAEIEKGWYTDESVANLREVINNIPTGLTVDRQNEVDEYAKTIVKATNDLIKKLANYTELQKILDLLDNSSSEIYNNTYKNFNEVMALIADYREKTVKNNMNLTVDKQSEVDKMAATLQGYIDSLEPETAKAVFEAKEGSTTVIKNGMIYGLSTGMTKSVFQSKFVKCENVTLGFSGNVGRYLGTGTTVTVTSTLTNEVIGTYKIIIYGDVDGNGLINVSDQTLLKKHIEKEIVLSTEAKMAGKIASRASVTVNDYIVLGKVIGKEATINQVTGKAK